MKETYEDDLASIRSMMERSVKFISLSGLSGVLAGIYALAGAWYANQVVSTPYYPGGLRLHYDLVTDALYKLLLTAALVLISSLATGFILSQRKAKKLGLTIWNNASRKLLLDLGIPLLAGGAFLLLLVWRGNYELIASTCLVFYGLALVNGSHSTFREIYYLGICEIVLGLLLLLTAGNALLFWSLGFGVLHIAYGLFMYYRYDR